MRARATIEDEDKGPARIIIHEIPFMVNKSRLIEQIAQLVRDKKLTDIRDMRDESDRDGLRVVIELKREAVPHVVLNRLYKHTQMQSTFGAILLALVDGVPQGDAAAGDAHPLHRPPAYGGGEAERVRSPAGPGAGTHPGRS